MICIRFQYLLWFGPLIALSGCRPPTAQTKPLQFTGRTMGTTYTVKLAALPAGHKLDDLKQEIQRRLDVVNRQMSTWRKDSEISRFNASRSTDWLAVSADTAAVVQEANRISQLSGGAFDVTVGPLVNLWSFGPQARPKTIPTGKQIDAAGQVVGHQHLRFRAAPPALKKTVPDLSVDLSAIAKGFGVDQIADYLDSLTVKGYLVEIGGEVRCRGTKGDGSLWQVGIQSPNAGKPTARTVVSLKNKAMATSGDYRNYFEAGGRRFSHTIDPRTGRPVTHQLASVSVIADSCMTADALATTLMVLGPEAGYNFAKQHKLAVLLLVRDGDGFKERTTREFQTAFTAKD